MNKILFFIIIALAAVNIAIAYDLSNPVTYDTSHFEDIKYQLPDDDIRYAVDYGCNITWNYLNKRGL